MEKETLAIIDLGTNTFHLLIAELNERDEFIVREKYKEPVKLGEGGISAGKIAKEAYKRGIVALKKFNKLIIKKDAGRVFAFATSAIRSAANGQEFIHDAKEKAGIDIRVINGNEEAALIFEGVKNGIALPYNEYSLIVDIGGGSVEFIVAFENKSVLLRSVDIGAARMLEHVLPGDPLSENDLKAAKKFLYDKLKTLLPELKEFKISHLVGSSGSFETIGSLVAHAKKEGLAASNLNNYKFHRTEAKMIHEKLIKLNRSQRLKMQGMEQMRVDMIVMGSIIIDLLLEELMINDILISQNALKEGIFYRYLDEKKQRVNRSIGPAEHSIRAKSVRNLAKKFDYKEHHALKVSELSVKLFDQLQDHHRFSDYERELLKYAAALHDIGHFVNRSGHHKHGQYIIMHSGLAGFSHDEIIIIGNIVRYHRKSLPTRDHFHFKVLSQRKRFIVRYLAGIIRIADNLDRGHRNIVNDIEARRSDNGIEIRVISSEEADIEIQSATNQLALLESVLDMKIEIVQA